MIRGAAGWLAALALTLSCAHPRPVSRTPTAAGASYGAALEQLRHRRFADAARGFEAYLAGAPAPDEVEPARYYLVLARVGAGECRAAATALATLRADGPLVPDARSAVASCVGRADAAQLDAVTAAQQLSRALADGDDVRALLLAARLSALGAAPEPAALDARIDALTEARLDVLAPLLDATRWPGSRVAFRRVALAAHVGDLARVQARLAELPAAAGTRTQADALVAALADRQRVRPGAIGVLLPLSGRFAAVGKELRVAIELAADGEPGVELVFVDTAGDEARAAAAVDEVVAKAHPILILGPVGEREATAAAARAAALEVPIALLTPKEGLADAAAGVFRLWSSGEARATAAARAAVALGYGALAVFAPRDDAGRAQADAFAAAVAAAGAQLVARAEYDPTATDLEGDVKGLLDLVPARNPRLRRHLARHGKDGWKTFSPDVPFDLLYIPGGYDHAGLVAAYLVYFNVELAALGEADSLTLRRKHGGEFPSFVQLLGSSEWHHPGLLTHGGQDVEGALLVDVFTGGEQEEYGTEEAAAFDERFRARAGRPASAVAAEAYDAARLALAARRRAAAGARGPEAGPALRRALVEALARGVVEQGACGPARVDAHGELQRTYYLLKVESGEFLLQDRIE